MYIRGLAGQTLGFQLSRIGDGSDYDTLTGVEVVRTVMLGAEVPVTGTIHYLRPGHFLLEMSAADCDGYQVTFQARAPGCWSQEKTILPFDGFPPGGGITVESDSLIPSFADVATLQFADDSGFSLTAPSAFTALVELLDATISQRGLVSTGFQDLAGTKIFHSDIGLPSGDLTMGAGSTIGFTGGGFIQRIGTSLRLGNARCLAEVMTGLYTLGQLGLTIYDLGGPITDTAYCIGQLSGGYAPYVGQWGTGGGGDTISGGIVTALGAGPSSVAWSSLTGVPNTLAGYGIASPLLAAVGGTGADLSASGPGVAVQPIAGGPLSVLAAGVDGNLLTASAGIWISAPPAITSPLTTKGDIWGFSSVDNRVPVGPDGYLLTADSGAALGVSWQAGGGGGLAIGAAVGGGTAGRVLYEDGSVHLADDAGFTYSSPGALTLISGGGLAGFYYGGSQLALTGYASHSANFCNANWAAEFHSAAESVDICAYGYALAVGAGSINVPGSSGNTYRFNAGVIPPSTGSVLVLPTATFGVAFPTETLTTPDVWALVNVGGTDYKVPLYL